MISITVNSSPRELDMPISVAELLTRENIRTLGGVAVAVNGKVVKKADHDTRLLADGDDVIIINAAYGG